MLFVQHCIFDCRTSSAHWEKGLYILPVWYPQPCLPVLVSCLILAYKHSEEEKTEAFVMSVMSQSGDTKVKKLVSYFFLPSQFVG